MPFAPRLALSLVALVALPVACVPAGGRGGTVLAVDSGAAPADADEPAPDASAQDADEPAPDAAVDASEGAPDAGTIADDAGTPGPDATPPDTGAPGRDAGPSPDAFVPDVGGSCGMHSPDMNGTTGPVNLIQEQGHGLPGCYRCAVGAADFDGDGRLDIVMAGPFDSAFTTPARDNYTYQNRVRVFRNVSCPGEEIRFELAIELPNARGGGGATLAMGDFDGDALPDFAVEFREGDAPDSNTAAFLNRGNFTFAKQSLGNFDSQSTSLGMAAADFDHDGRDDLVLISDAYGDAPGLWYRWNGTRFDAQQTDYTHRITYGGTVAAGDLDGDGYPDLAVGGNSNLPFGTYDCSSTLLYGELHFNRGVTSPAIAPEGLALTGFAMRVDRSNIPPCEGMDNAGMLIADMDGDGYNDVIVAGSASSFPGPPPGPPQSNGSQYDFAVLFNRDGTGRNFVGWENAGAQYPGGTTNGGTGNMDGLDIAVGDLDGDGLPEAFIQGHHRDYAANPGAYVFDTRLFLNVGGTRFLELELGLPDVGEGGQVIADFNDDGKLDLIYAGATLPFHSNGTNSDDDNTAATLFAYVYRNTRP